MNQAVCNSSPIIALSSIKKLTLLTELFQHVYIPQAVHAEVLNTDNHAVGGTEVQAMLETDCFSIYKVKNVEAVHRLYGKLHFGEIEVIMAAKELSISDVILDDLPARKLAETFLLQPIGTLGILLLAKKEGVITVLKPLLDELIDKNFRVSRKLYEQILKFVDE